MIQMEVNKGILRCEVHCIDESSLKLQELGIGGNEQYEWKEFYIDLDSVTAIGEFEDQNGEVQVAVYVLSGDSFVVNSDLKKVVALWSEYKSESKW